MDCRGKQYVAMLKAAMRGGYVVGAFNVDSLDVLGLLAGRVAQTHSPAIFQLGPWSFSHVPIEQTIAAARALTSGAPACFIHLDHCPDADVLGRCVEAGFDSVMFDGSDLPLEQNIARTRQVVATGRSRGAAVEGALGRLEDGGDTDPAEAARFVRETGVDALAVAIGTRHGQPRTAGQIDLERLAALSRLGVPLVIHGGSGLPTELTGEVRRSAVAKLNVATACRREADRSVAEFLSRHGPTGSVSSLAGAAADGFWKAMRERMEWLGCLGKEASA